MITPEQISSLKEYLQNAETVMVVVGPKPSDDQLAIASALYQGIGTLGKEVGIYSPKKLSRKSYVGFKDISTELGKQNLVVELDYIKEAVDKVSYHISEELKKFYLTIKPKKGAKPLDDSTVSFSYAGADADLIILVGVHELEDLEQLYFGYESLYENAFLAVIHSFEPELGNAQFDLSGTSSLSESMVELLSHLDIQLTADMATDLLKGIEKTTNKLQSLSVTAETFDAVASLLRAGARRTYNRPGSQQRSTEGSLKNNQRPGGEK